MDHVWGKNLKGFSYVIVETVSYVDTNNWNYMYIHLTISQNCYGWGICIIDTQVE